MKTKLKILPKQQSSKAAKQQSSKVELSIIALLYY
jgi:hypothetical protein